MCLDSGVSAGYRHHICKRHCRAVETVPQVQEQAGYWAGGESEWLVSGQDLEEP